MRGPEGELVYIIHRTEDVTDFVVGEGRSAASMRALRDIEQRDALLELDILLRSRELKAANNRLLEQEANLRTAQRLLGLGLWKRNIDTGEWSWSDDIYRMYGISKSDYNSTNEAYRALVHPDDRETMLASMKAYNACPGPHFEFQHRIIRPDGKVVHLRGIGEYTETGDGRILTGVLQDVTAEIEAAARLDGVTRLQRLAGRAAHLGGWRADLDTDTVQWTEETALIHEMPGRYLHTVDAAIAYYEPVYRGRLREQLARCVERGEAFDNVMQLTTANGNRRWVHIIGEAEYDHGRALPVPCAAPCRTLPNWCRRGNSPRRCRSGCTRPWTA
ncbi:PAS domain-containing protein [Kineobactrum salinum]|uniref:histidine kinase n=1 Tax=Kineobactrum salinum TaxID=2708301 RepID=A0A6C0U261_9GAMM|nr:PAS domain-containing protein [Kineobactrum salinum]QIB64455.1 PAS domain-containing protein [Kineobactrum salinum]